MKGLVISIGTLMPSCRQAHLQAWNLVSRQIRKEPLARDDLKHPENSLFALATVEDFMGGNDCIDELRYWANKEQQIFEQICQKNQLRFQDPEKLFSIIQAYKIPTAVICPAPADKADFYRRKLGLIEDTDHIKVYFQVQEEGDPAEIYQRAMADLGLDPEESLVMIADYSDLAILMDLGFSRYILYHLKMSRKTLHNGNARIDICQSPDQVNEVIAAALGSGLPGD